jgi:hypothetical protein
MTLKYLPLVLLGIFAASTTLAQAPATERLVLLDGATVEASIVSITNSGSVTGTGVPEGLQLDALRRVERMLVAAADTPKSELVIDIVGGGQIALTKFAVDSEQVCHVQHATLGEFTLPLDSVRSVRFSSAKTPAAFEKALRETSEDDRMFVKVGEEVQPISGLIEKIDEFNVVFSLDDEQRTIARDKMYGIVVAMIGRPIDRTGQVQVTLADGSSLWGKLTSLADGKLLLAAGGGSQVSIPWAAVQNFAVRSDRLVFLSDLEPLTARHQPLVTLVRPWQRDRSIGGRPLTLGAKVFGKGIGVASRSEIAFANESNFDLLAATIGIDAETEGRGDCVFVIEAGGKEVFRQRMSGKDAPKTVSVPIAGVEKVTLIVEPGEDLDLADHANWCDARFVRK